MNGFVAGLLTGALSLGAIAYAPGLGPLQQGAGPRNPAPTPDKVERSLHVDVCLRDSIDWRGNVDSREVELVKACIAPALSRFSDPFDAARAVREVLGASFPSRVTSDEPHVTYKARWDEELHRFVVICCESTEVQVDVDGVVVSVPMAIGTVLD